MEFSHDPRSHRFRRTRPRRTRTLSRSRPLLAAGALAALALPGSAVAARSARAPHRAHAAKHFTVRAHFPNHTPTANRNWPIRLTVTKRRAKLSGSVRYEFKFQGAVVSHQPGHRFKHGLYKDKLLFPSDAVGQSLTLVVVVKTKYGTEDVNWAVKTRK